MYPLVGDEQRSFTPISSGKKPKSLRSTGIKLKLSPVLKKQEFYPTFRLLRVPAAFPPPISHLGRLDGTGPFTGRPCLQTQFTPNKASPRTPRLLIAAPSQRGASEWKTECRRRCAANEGFSEGPFPYFGREPHPQKNVVSPRKRLDCGFTLAPFLEIDPTQRACSGKPTMGIRPRLRLLHHTFSSICRLRLSSHPTW